MRGVVMYGPGDVRVEERDKPTIIAADRRGASGCPRRASAARTCGPTAGPTTVAEPTPMGHEYVGVVEEVGSAVTTVEPGQFVVGSFFASDNTCEICRAGYQSSCVHREWRRRRWRPGRVPARPAGRRHPGRHPRAARPTTWSRRLLAASDVLGTGWFGAVAAEAGPGKTVAVVGDGAVGLLGVLAARELGAERIIAMSRHADRQAAGARVRRHRHRRRTRRRGRGRGQGAHRRARRAQRDRGRRHPGVDDAGHPRHPPRRARRLRRRRPRREPARRGAVLLRRPPARRPRPGAPVPARPDRPDLEPADRPREGVRPHPAPRAGRRRPTRRWTSARAIKVLLTL